MGFDIERFRTVRLRAERLAPRHLAELVAMHRDPAVMETLGGVRTPAATEDYLAANLKHWDEHGFGLWMLYDWDGGFAGRGCIRRAELDGADEVEIGYAFRRPYWGRGLASEFARACVAIGFTALGLDDLVAIATPDNLASRRVMEKTGLRFEKTFDYNGIPSVLYRILRAAPAA
jgi:RimJ/RimL family protein N-acetyltransferase